jgi:hypothetical protein
MTNSITAGMGFLMDHAETFIVGPSLRQFHEVTLIEESSALHRHDLIRFEPLQYFHLIC